MIVIKTTREHVCLDNLNFADKYASAVNRKIVIGKPECGEQEILLTSSKAETLFLFDQLVEMFEANKDNVSMHVIDSTHVKPTLLLTVIPQKIKAILKKLFPYRISISRDITHQNF